MMGYILSGLKYLHRVGIVDCDLKPANILVRPNNTIVLADFASAKYAQRLLGGPADAAPAFTPNYCALEIGSRFSERWIQR